MLALLKRFEPKYLNVLFVTSLIASILCNICFLALKVVRVKELQKSDFTIMKVRREIKKIKRYHHIQAAYRGCGPLLHFSFLSLLMTSFFMIFTTFLERFSVVFRGTFTGILSMLLTSTMIPAVLVIITSVKLDSLSYYSLLTPSQEEGEEELDYQDLIITGLLSMLLVVLLQAMFLVALTTNIYLFSEKIFHLVTYRRIL